MTRAALLIVLLVCGCASPPPGPEPRSNGAAVEDPAPETPTASAPSTPTAPSSSTALAPTGSVAPSSSATTCASLASQFDAALAAASGACKSNADCACYADLRVDGKLGVTDAATAPQLQAISDDYRERQCPTIFASSAAPPQCKARCDAGTCR